MKSTKVFVKRVIIVLSMLNLCVNIADGQNNIICEHYKKFSDDSICEYNIVFEDTTISIKQNSKIEWNHGQIVCVSQFYQDTSGTHPIGTYIKLNDKGNIICIGQYETDLKCLEYNVKELIDSIYIGRFFSGAIEFGYYKFPRVGKWLLFSNDGYIIEESYYKNEFSPENGCVERKVGIWKYYDNHGVLIDSVNHDN